MARRTVTVTIDAEGRDKGKRFLITEVSAAAGEEWAFRAFLALAKSGVDIPTDVRDAGFAGIAVMGVRALSGMSYYDAKPLLDEMMACIVVMPNPNDSSVTRALIPDDIEEIATRLRLRGEVVELHTGFSAAGAMRERAAETKSPA